MNSQLYAHLAAFDSCEDSGEQTSDCLSSVGGRSDADGDDAKVTANIESFQSNHNEDEDDRVTHPLETFAVYIPIVVALSISSSRNEELIAFLLIARASFAWLVSWQQQQSGGRWAQQSQQKVPVISSCSPRHQVEVLNPNESLAPPDTRKKHFQQDIYECRNELSRLLGLIGAPPMGGQSFVEDQDYSINRIFAESGQLNAPGSIDDATVSVVSFLEAHVQIVLMIDKALYWVKICSSLHWGLGPHSNCVERVERAAMSKELFSARRRSAEHRSNRTNHVDGESDNCTTRTPNRMDQPQNRMDSSSILALSSARRNIAHVIVKEVNSIVNTLGIFDAEFDDCDERYVNNEFFEMPAVVDIAWIKASRKYLANVLAFVAEKFSTWEALRSMSGPEASQLPSSQPLQALHESMWTARNLREYLTSHLLLDDDHSPRRLGSVRPISSSRGAGNEQKYILPILQYQKQLDALDAALWSFQQYVYSQDSDTDVSSLSACATQDSLDGVLCNDNEANQTTTFRSSAAKLTWWNQVKEISVACQTLEEEIGRQFFSSLEDDQDIEGEYDGSDGSNMPLNHERNAASKTQNYEHIEGETSEASKKPSLKTTKTLVFSGEGSKEKKVSKKIKKSTVGDDSGTMKLQSEGHSTAAPLPSPRDPFAEHLLLRELQNRIRSVAAMREEEQVDGSRTEFEATCGENDEDQQSSQDEMISDENLVDSVDEESLPQSGRRDYSNEVSFSSRKPAVTTNIFLGASGSLLEELKMNMILPDADDIVLSADDEEQ